VIPADIKLFGRDFFVVLNKKTAGDYFLIIKIIKTSCVNKRNNGDFEKN
jgi:hypothetical protein